MKLRVTRPAPLTLATILTALALPVQHARAQSRDWVLTFLVSPRPSPFLSDYDRNPSLATLTTVYTGTSPRDYRIEVVARSSQGEIARVISPQLNLPAGPVTLAYTASDMADWHTESSNPAYITVVKRAGVVPEGTYQLCARILDLKGAQQAQACTNISIVLPEPPRLIAPANLSRLAVIQPVLQWTPVVAPPELGLTYHVRVAEILGTQTPQTALLSNRPYYDGTVTTPFLVYPMDALPLRGDRQYAWQVEALDASGHAIARRNGQSEIWTFHPGDLAFVPTDRLPDTLDLIPGVARLRGLSTAGVVESRASYRINGQVTLDLLGGMPASMQVNASDLVVDRGALPSVDIRSGQVSGSVSGRALALPGARVVRVTDVAYTVGSGITFGAALTLPDGNSVPLSGRLTPTPMGLYGQLTASAPAGSTLGTFGADPVQLGLTKVSASFPDGDVSVQGALQLFGTGVGCDNVTLAVTAGAPEPKQVACAMSTDVPLVAAAGGSGAMPSARLMLSSVNGTLSLDLGTGSLGASLDAAADALVSAGSSTAAVSCGASGDLAIDPNSVSFNNARPHCTGGADADFGWLVAKLSNPALQRLSYQPGRGGSSGKFDFAFTMDLAARVPALGLALPAMQGVGVTSSGLTIPAVDGAVSGASGTFGPVAVQLTHVRSAPVTISWSDWQTHSPQGFHFGADGSIALASLAGASPACLASSKLAVDSAVIGGGQLSAFLTTGDLATPCVIPLGAGASFELDGASGRVAAAIAGGTLTGSAYPQVHGAFLLPDYFACGTGGSATARRVPLPASLSLGSHGGLVGKVSGLAPPCPLDLPVVQLALTNGTMTFDDSTAGEAEHVVLAGSATASFGGGSDTTKVQGSGTATVDVLAGKWISGSLDFRGPFRLDLPRSAPVLSFQVASATLDSAGLGIDGRASLLLPGGSTVGATFAKAELDPTTLKLTSGKVLFDAGFALAAQVGDSGGNAAWHAAPRGAPLGSGNAVRIDLPATISLGSTGLAVAGTGVGALAIAGHNADSLVATFSNDFSVTLAGEVQSGRVDLAHQATNVAYVDPQGFHPDLGALAMGVLPARIGLPTEAVAYIQLKDGQGNALVKTEQTQGGMRVYTAPGQNVALVVPALANGGTAPQVNVGLDVVIDPAQARVVSGAVRTAVASGTAGFNLGPAGLPIAIDTLAYDNGSGSYQLTLGGSLGIFGTPVTASPRAVLLTVDGGGHATGTVNLQPNQRIPVGSSGALALTINTVQGTVDAQLLGGPRRFQLDMDSRLDFNAGTNTTWGAGVTLALTDGGLQVTKVNANGSTGLAFDLGLLHVALSNLSIPHLTWDRTNGFDVALAADAAFSAPALGGLTLPTVTGLSLDAKGITIPAFSVPDIQSSMFSGGNGVLAVAGMNLRPLAFRMDSLRYAWGSTPGTPSSVSVDMELSLGALGQAAPAGLADLRLSVLGAGIQNGRLTGTIQARTLAQPIALPLFSITSLGGSVAVPVDSNAGAAPMGGPVAVRVTGHAVLPQFLRCTAAPDGAVPPTTDTLSLGADGSLSGSVRGLVPACPAVWGPLTFAVTSGELDFAGSGNGAAALLKSAGTLKIAAGPADTASGSGTIGIDLVAGRIVSGSVTVNQPFQWSPVSGGAFPRFTLSRATLDSAGLHLSGDGSLALDGGASAAAHFQNLTLDPVPWAITDGQVTIDNNFSLAVGLNAVGAPTWSGGPASAQLPSSMTAGAVVTAPGTITLDKHGLSLAGTSNAALSYGGRSFATLSTGFANGFTLALSPVGVSTGRATFITGSDTVAYIDSTGFVPGNLFGLVAMPDSIPVPEGHIAYIRLKDGSGKALVSTSSSGNDLHLTGSGVQLVIPALASNGTTPSVSANLDITVNRTSWSPTGGSITVSAAQGQALISLRGAGVPLDITKLSVAARSGSGFSVRIDSARLVLPAALGAQDAELDMTNVQVGASGLSGTASIGSVASTYQTPNGTPPFPAVPVSKTTDGVTVQLAGAQVTFGPQWNGKVAGLVQSDLFAPAQNNGNTGQGIYFVGALSNNAFSATVDGTNLGTLPIGPASFTPQAINSQPGIAIAASNTDFEVTLNGTVRIPQLGSSFAVTLQGLQVGTNGVHLPNVSLSQQNAQQSTLWGLPLTLQDSVNGSQIVKYALALSRNPQTKVVTMEASGYLKFLGNSTRFVGLEIGTDGHLHLLAANLIDRPITLVSSTLTVNTLTISSDVLHAVLGVTLPAPLPTQAQQGAFDISPDGTIKGAANLALFDYGGGVSGAPAALAFGPLGTFVLRHVSLALNAQSLGASELDADADFVVKNDPNQGVINVGYVDGGVNHPGLAVTFAGGRNFGNVRASNGFALDFDVAKLAVGSNGVSLTTTSSGFDLGISGQLSVKATAVTGTVELDNLVLSSTGKLDFAKSTLGGGGFTVAGVASMSLTSIGFSDQPTQLKLASGSVPSGGNGSASAGTQSVSVLSYLKFGASVGIGQIMSGGVDSALFYRTANGVSFSAYNMHLSVANAIEGHGDLALNTADNSLFVAGSGQLLGQPALGTIQVAGAFEQDQGTTRMGVFVAASIPGGIPITPVTPAASLVGVGGGFFIHPRNEWLQYVAQNADVTNGGATVPSGDDPNMAILLFGEVNLGPPGSPKVADGKVLVTVTDVSVRLQGKLVLLGQTGNLDGVADLYGNWHRGVITGNIHVNAQYTALVQGQGQLQFFAYSNAAANAAPSPTSNASYPAPNWGITGTLTAHIVGLINMDADFFAGPPGFVASVSAENDLPGIAFVSLDSVGVMLWYTQTTGFGAVAAVKGSLNVIPDVLSADATLEGALIDGNPSFVYAEASLHVDAAVASWTGSVWASVTNGNLDGGTGSNPQLEQAIAEAQQAAAQVNAAKSSAEQALASAQTWTPDAVAFSNSELAKAYDWLSHTGMKGTLSVENALSNETICIWIVCLGSKDLGGGSDYRTWYSWLVQQYGIPADTVPIKNAGQTVNNLMAQINSRSATAWQKVDAIKADIAAATQVATSTSLGSSPLTTRFGAPVATMHVSGKDTTYAVDASQSPTLAVDATRAQQIKTKLAASRQTVQQQAQDAKQRIQSVEQALTSIRAATTAGGSGSLLDFARLHANVVSTAQQQAALQANYLLGRKLWFKGAIAKLNSRQSDVSWVDAEVDKIQQLAPLDSAGPIAPFSALASSRFRTLTSYIPGLNDTATFVYDSTTLMNAIATDKGAMNLNNMATQMLKVVADNRAAQTYFANQAKVYGHQLWYDMAGVGMDSAMVHNDSVLKAFAVQSQQKLDTLRQRHAKISTSLGQLFDGQAALEAALYDLYDRYIALYATANASTTVAFKDRRTALANDLKVPHLTGGNVTATVNGYAATFALSWAGTQPASGIYEYVFDPTGRNKGGADYTWLSTGTSGSLGASVFATTPTEVSYGEAFGVGVRGGAGYLGVGTIPITVQFKPPTFDYDYSTTNNPPLPPQPTTTTVTVASAAPDSTPPATPVVAFANASGPRPGTVWTSDTAAVDVTWSSTDRKSGISEYRYRVQTVPSGSSGVTQQGSNASFTSAGGRGEMKILNSGLSMSTGVKVDVVAVNGTGVVSQTATTPLLRLDTTPPVWALRGTLNVASPVSTADIGRQSRTQAQGAPGKLFPACTVADLVTTQGTSGGQTGGTYGSSAAWQGGLATISLANPSGVTMPTKPTRPAVSIDLTRPDASDPESGIAAYAWRIDTVPAKQYTASAWVRVAVPSFGNASTRFHIDGGDSLDYTHQYYVSVVALNWAGLPSAPLITGPFTVRDPSRPEPPKICASLTGGVANGSGKASLSVTFVTPAADSQSGIAGYVYRIRKSSGQTLREFPSTGVDWTGSAAATAGATTTTSSVSVTNGEKLYVDVSTIDGQGLAAYTVSSGPVIIDQSPPPAHLSLGGSYGLDPVSRQWSLSLNANVADDPQSGLERVEVAIGTTADKTDVLPWTAVAGGHAGAASYVVPIVNPLGGGSYVVQVRAVNGANLAGPSATMSFTAQTFSSNGSGMQMQNTQIKTGASCTAAQQAAHTCS